MLQKKTLKSLKTKHRDKDEAGAAQSQKGSGVARRLDSSAQAQGVRDDDRAPPALDQAAALHGVEFARHGFAPRVDAGGEFRLVWRGDDDRAPRVSPIRAGKTQEFGVNPSADVQGAEFADS